MGIYYFGKFGNPIVYIVGHPVYCPSMHHHCRHTTVMLHKNKVSDRYVKIILRNATTETLFKYLFLIIKLVFLFDKSRGPPIICLVIARNGKFIDAYTV